MARRHGADARALVCDVTDVAALQAAFAGVEALDILVCSAGADVPQPLAELDLDAGSLTGCSLKIDGGWTAQ